MKTTKDSIRFKIVFPFFIMTLFIFAILIFGTYRVQSNHLNQVVENKVKEVNKLFAELLAKESKFMSAQLEFIAGDTELIKAWQTRNRDGLYSLADQIFKKISNNFNVTHFYFIEPDKTCFLRVHAPGRYGDLITRHTLQEAVDHTKINNGIELGPLGTFTLRVVYPWINNGRLFGFLELGEEIKHLTPQLSAISGVELIFTINKSNLKKEEFETGIKLIGKDDTWKDFKSFVVIDKSLPTLTPDLKNIIQKSYFGRIRSQNISYNNHMLRLAVTPLIDAPGNKVGDIIALYDFTDQSAATKKTLLFLILVSLVVVAILFIFYYLYSGKIEKQVNTYRNYLHDLVAERTQKLQHALDEIKTLKGFFPICSSCKKIRDDKGYWNQIESYLSRYSEAKFSHSLCPDCSKKLYPEYNDEPEDPEPGD